MKILVLIHVPSKPDLSDGGSGACPIEQPSVNAVGLPQAQHRGYSIIIVGAVVKPTAIQHCAPQTNICVDP